MTESTQARNVGLPIILLLAFYMLIYYYNYISNSEVEGRIFIDGVLCCKTQREREREKCLQLKKCYINSKQLQNFKKLE